MASYRDPGPFTAGGAHGQTGQNVDGSGQSSTEAQTEERRTKRKRVAMACDRCRAKKSRCDGAQPICSMCRAGEYRCSYKLDGHTGTSKPAINASTPPLPKIDQSEMLVRFVEMENRLRTFEQELSRARNSYATPLSGERDYDGIENLDTVQDSNLRASVVTHNPVPDPAGTAQFETDRDETSINPMGVLAFSDEQLTGYFGPSSNVALIRHISNAIATTRDPTFSSSVVSSDINNAIVSSSRPPSEGLPSWVQAAGCKLYDLPPESQVLELAQDYFSNTGLLFPHIHADTFFETYARMKREAFKNVRMSWLALFNMILANAMCSRTDDKLGFAQRISASEVFYQRAAGLTNQRNMQGTSVEMVQYLLLMVQYLQSSQRTIQTYAVHGQAVKSAFQIGLQSEEVSKRFPPLERETRKRAWYACVLIDRYAPRTLSVTFGRPASIPDCYVQMAMPVSIPEWTVAPNLTSDASTGLLFFNSTIKLYRILWGVIDRLYGQNIGENRSAEGVAEVTRHVVEFEHQLDEWLCGVPLPLKPINEDWNSYLPQSNSTTARLRTILSLRYLNLRCSLHRPVVMILLGNGGKGYPPEAPRSFNEEILWQSVRIALDSATGVITIITKLGGHKQALGAYWFSLYYIFNAALLVFAIGLICSEESRNVDRMDDTLNQVHQALRMAVIALPTIDVGNGTVDKCCRYLEKLLELRLLRSTNEAPLVPGLTTSSTAGLTRTPSSLGERRAPTSESVQNSDSRWFMPETQDWVLDDLDMGPFVMDNNLDYMDELLGYPSTNEFSN